MCGHCGGKGDLKTARRSHPTDKHFTGDTFPDLPDVLDYDGEYLGDIAQIGDEGINVEHWDGKLWSFYAWDKVPNAAKIQAAWEQTKSSLSEGNSDDA